MTQSFREKWLTAVDEKNSVLCAGLDPAEFGMSRGEKGLPEGMPKTTWSLKYIEAIAPHCAAIKLNIQYWKNMGGMGALESIIRQAHALNLVVIEDSKLADIGSTNDAGIFYARQKAADAVTFSPFAGNIQEATQQAHARGLGLISMVLMSNPEYEREKNSLKPIDKSQVKDYLEKRDIVYVNETPHVRQYTQLAHDANEFGVDGIVIGAPSKKNHIQDYEIAIMKQYVNNKMLVLLPGVGAQGGEAGTIWEYFDKNNVIVNVGRSLMLPTGSNSTPKDQAETAKHYKDMLNDLRTKTI